MSFSFPMVIICFHGCHTHGTCKCIFYRNMASAKRDKQPAKRGKPMMMFEPHLIIDPQKLQWYGKIGAGGCGEVYEVEHAEWGWLAIKKLGVTHVEEK